MTITEQLRRTMPKGRARTISSLAEAMGISDKSRYAVDASGNWRITFGWTEGDAVGVDLEDYH